MGKSIQEYTIDELQSKAKLLKTCVTVLLVLVAIVVAFGVYQYVNEKPFNVGVMIPAGVAVLGGMIPSLSMHASIKKELEKRRSDS